jgi:hypothetical protein
MPTLSTGRGAEDGSSLPLGRPPWGGGVERRELSRKHRGAGKGGSKVVHVIRGGGVGTTWDHPESGRCAGVSNSPLSGELPCRVVSSQE